LEREPPRPARHDSGSRCPSSAYARGEPPADLGPELTRNALGRAERRPPWPESARQPGVKVGSAGSLEPSEDSQCRGPEPLAEAGEERGGTRPVENGHRSYDLLEALNVLRGDQ